VLDADGTSGDRLTVRSYNVGDGRLPTNQRRENVLGPAIGSMAKRNIISLAWPPRLGCY
jgi:hypothetical protein